MSGTSKHEFMPEASEEGRDADAVATDNEGEGRESDYFEE